MEQMVFSSSFKRFTSIQASADTSCGKMYLLEPSDLDPGATWWVWQQSQALLVSFSGYYHCNDVLPKEKRPNAATITLLYCLWVSVVETNSCSKSGTCVKCDLFLSEGGCFSTPSFHPETKTGCGPPSASGPGSVKETLHRQGSCIDVQVLIYLLCTQSVLCCVVLSCVWPKRCCNARFFHFSQTPRHNFTPRSHVHSLVYVNRFIFTRIRWSFFIRPSWKQTQHRPHKVMLSDTMLADRWTELQAIAGGKQHAWWDKEGRIWLTSFRAGAAVSSENEDTFKLKSILLKMSCFKYFF